ncbi:hypothetical protein BGW39_004512 [Mortierella sp. 14UC]|nr:hypothetical protein BGW39_004512 [Mortierella sp. 14UC]
MYRYTLHLRRLYLGSGISDLTLSAQAYIIRSELKLLFHGNIKPLAGHFDQRWYTSFRLGEGVGLSREGYIGENETDAYVAAVEKWMSRIQQQLQKFSLDDVYSCNLKGVYVRPIPTHYSEAPSDYIHRIVNTSCVSILLCSNAAGTDRRKLLVA